MKFFPLPKRSPYTPIFLGLIFSLMLPFYLSLAILATFLFTGTAFLYALRQDKNKRPKQAILIFFWLTPVFLLILAVFAYMQT